MDIWTGDESKEMAKRLGGYLKRIEATNPNTAPTKFVADIVELYEQGEIKNLPDILTRTAWALHTFGSQAAKLIAYDLLGMAHGHREPPVGGYYYRHRNEYGIAFNPPYNTGTAVEIYNGMPAKELSAEWRKSARSNPSGNCVELAPTTDGNIAMRNSRFADGPALVFTRDEVRTFFSGVKDGEFNDLIKE